MRNTTPPKKLLSRLEELVMTFLWANGACNSEQVRQGLLKRHAMKDATIRTILRRLEAKGYITHREEGRTYVYSTVVKHENVAMRTVRGVIDRFWGGSARALVAGLVEDEAIDPAELRELAGELAAKLEQRATERKK